MLRGMDIPQMIQMAVIVLISLTFHEFSHGWVSSKLGDPTPRATGRLSLNPISHLEPIGALLMVLTGFGWAKPVQINPRYYKNPKKGMALTAAAGPIANVLLAFVGLIVYTIIFILYIKLRLFTNSIESIGSFFVRFASINLSFALFNIIPIPPLDGSRVLGLFLPSKIYFRIQQYERYSFILIIILSYLGVFEEMIGNGVWYLMSMMVNLCQLFVNAIL